MRNLHSETLADWGTTAPAAPASGVTLYGASDAGRATPAWVPAAGTPEFPQAHLGRSMPVILAPVPNNVTLTTLGLAVTATGTATAAAVATTNRHQMTKRLDYLVTVAATTAVAGWRSAVQGHWAVGGAAAGLGGFSYVCRWGPATGVATTTNRAFTGMANSTVAPTDVEPSTITNMCGMGWDAADAQVQFMYRGAGAVVKVPLGASFPVPTADRASLYELAMWSPPGTTQTLGYRVTDLVSGAVASGTTTTGLPTTATFLNPRSWMSVGGTSSVIGVTLAGLYIDTDS